VSDLSFIQLIDIAAVVEFFDETEIGEVLGLCTLCPWAAG
jgi:hypothetical protein